MPQPPDAVVVPEGTDSPEDPLGLFPSELQKVPSEIAKIPAEALKVHSEVEKIGADEGKAAAIRRPRAVDTVGRWLVLQTIPLFARVFAGLITASRRVARFAAALCVFVASAIRRLRLPKWRIPAWRPSTLRLSTLRLSTSRLSHLRLQSWHVRAWRFPKWPVSGVQIPAWHLPAWRHAALHLPVWRLAAWRTQLGVFACGLIVGGSAVWLLGTSRDGRVAVPASQQAPREDSRAATSPLASGATAPANTAAVEGGSRTAVTTAAARARRTPFRGSLVVNSRPPGARVFLNGRNVGQTPLVLRNQPAGSRAVRVALDGYEPWSSAVRVVADTETRLRAELKMQRPVPLP
jgi:hypothetical protein